MLIYGKEHFVDHLGERPLAKQSATNGEELIYNELMIAITNETGLETGVENGGDIEVN